VVSLAETAVRAVLVVLGAPEGPDGTGEVMHSVAGQYLPEMGGQEARAEQGGKEGLVAEADLVDRLNMPLL
jgi:hypothetical protein